VTVVRVSVLGELLVEVNGHSVQPPATWRARSLLAWLALHPGQHPRNVLAARFWPEVLDTSARASLRNALWSLRRALGPDGAACLIATRDRVGLADAWVDARELDELERTGSSAGALALCRGELLAGLDDEWILEAREEYRARIGGLCARAAAAAEAAGDQTTALGLTRDWVASDALSEPAHRELMRRLAATGDRAGALAVHRRLEQRLRRELHAAPSADTRRLAEQLRQEQPGLDVGDETVELRRSALPPRLAADPTAAFVGRAADLRQLRDWWEQARSRQSVDIALIAGDAGIGKSRLARELAVAVHAGGFTVLHGVAHADRLIPYQPFLEALQGFERTLGEQPGTPPEMQQLRLFQRVVGLLADAAAHGPLLVLIDDLHNADPSTARLLDHLLGVPDLCGLVVATWRPGEAAAGALADLLARARRDRRLHELALGGLSGEEVEQLLAPHAVSQPGEVLARAEGNPLFVLELLRSGGAAGLPPGILDVIGRRLATLSPDCRRQLQGAAVLGREFDLDVLERLASANGEAFLEALEEAIDAGVIEEVPGPGERGSFTHALLHQAVRDSLSATRRRRLHLAAADLVEELRPSEHGAVARHLCEAGAAADPARIAAHALRAGEQARALGAFDEEVTGYSRVLAALPESALPERRDLTIRRAIAFQRLGHVVVGDARLRS
jgi:DNA-binding SARP family transcriptional activator